MITHIILFAYAWAALFGFGIAPFLPGPSEPATAETRCGWFENPTPANAWLVDRDGEWTIAVQGGYQAEGTGRTFPTRDGSRQM